MEWERLIKERNDWVAHNFPDSAPIESVWGCLEEVGELAHAHLKERQNIRGDIEEHQENAMDSIGDLMVFLLGVMNEQGYIPPDYTDPPIAQRMESADHWLMMIGMAVGRLCEHPTWSVPIYQLIFYSRMYCISREWDFEAIVYSTWSQVLQRDWKKDPVAGGEVK